MEHLSDLIAAPTDLSTLQALQIAVHRGVRGVSLALAATPAGSGSNVNELRTYWAGVAKEATELNRLEAAFHAVLAERSPKSRAAIGRATADHRTISALIAQVDDGLVTLAMSGDATPAARSAKELDAVITAHLDAAQSELARPLQNLLDVIEHQRIYDAVVVSSQRRSFTGPFVASWVAPSHWQRIRGHRLIGRPGPIARGRHARLANAALGVHRHRVLDERFDPPVTVPASTRRIRLDAGSAWTPQVSITR